MLVNLIRYLELSMWFHMTFLCENGNECLLIFILHVMCVHVGVFLLSLDNMPLTLTLSLIPALQSIILISQVFTLLVTF